MTDHELMKNFKEIYDKEIDIDWVEPEFNYMILDHSFIRMFCYEICKNVIKDYIKRKRIIEMIEALEIHEKYNQLHNDTDAYLYDVIQWALLDEQKPDPKWFGIEEWEHMGEIK